MEKNQVKINTMKRQLIQALVEYGKPENKENLAKSVGVTAGDTLFLAALGEAAKTSEIIRMRDGRYGVPRMMSMICGRLQRNIRGFGFVSDGGEDDLFIPAHALAGAMGGDTVLATRLPMRPGSKGPDGKVEKIISRAHKTIVGRIDDSGRIPRLIPAEASICDAVYIDKRYLNGAKNGDVVVLEMRTYPDGTMPAYGAVREVLGDPGAPGTDVTSIMRTYGIYEEFPKPVAQAAAKLANAKVSPDEIEGREDFRDVFTVTIDGADSKDFDDAVGAERVADGIIRLYVHIADVTHYVTPGSVLDKEAYSRGTSVYLPDRVAPMLPIELSNGICSLNQGEDRLCMSVVMDFDKSGRCVSSEISRGVINVDHRLVYDDVTNYFNGKRGSFDDELCRNLDVMRELSKRLSRVRSDRGSIDFETSESEIILDKKGHAIDIMKKEVGEANGMIEEFMLEANEAVAKFLSDLELPCIYRVHEEPDAERVKSFNEFLEALGYSLPKTRPLRPKAFRELLLKIKGRDEEPIVSRTMLRTMQKARYASSNLGHYGLALDDYCHFTSPIRRYPDLMVHRVLGLHLDGKMDEATFKSLEESMDEIADQCSKNERNAMETERAADDLKKCEYMHDHMGENFDAIISGVASYGFYAELENTVEGLVRVNMMRDDEYMFDDKRQQLIGKRRRRVFKMGDHVRVACVGADLATRNVDFSLIV